MVFPLGQGERKFSQCGYLLVKGGVTFSRFCAVVFYGRLLILHFNYAIIAYDIWI